MCVHIGFIQSFLGLVSVHGDGIVQFLGFVSIDRKPLSDELEDPSQREFAVRRVNRHEEQTGVAAVCLAERASFLSHETSIFILSLFLFI